MCEADLGIYDYAALVPVLIGAGASVTDWGGAPLGIHTHAASRGRVLASSNAALHAQALAALAMPPGVQPEFVVKQHLQVRLRLPSPHSAPPTAARLFPSPPHPTNRVNSSPSPSPPAIALPFAPLHQVLAASFLPSTPVPPSPPYPSQVLAPYLPPLDGRSASQHLLLDFNERTVPPPAHVTDALVAHINLGTTQCYPAYGDINTRIAEYANVDPSQCMITNGSDQGIDLIIRACCPEGSEAIIPAPTFAMYEQVRRHRAALRPLHRRHLKREAARVSPAASKPHRQQVSNSPCPGHRTTALSCARGWETLAVLHRNPHPSLAHPPHALSACPQAEACRASCFIPTSAPAPTHPTVPPPPGMPRHP